MSARERKGQQLSSAWFWITSRCVRVPRVTAPSLAVRSEAASFKHRVGCACLGRVLGTRRKGVIVGVGPSGRFTLSQALSLRKGR